jgi:hypothetical protein
MLDILFKKNLVFTGILLAAAFVANAQTKLPVDKETGKVSYKFTVDLDRSYKTEATYAFAQDWMKQNPGMFQRGNQAAPKLAPSDTNGQKAAVLKLFTNTTPLQAVDPESNRVSGKIVTRYAGGGNGCIRLMYLQYSIVLVAKGNKLHGEITNIVYNHFHPRSYQPQPVFNWSGQMPCDQVNTLEYIQGCESCAAEFQNFYLFLDADMFELINNLRDYAKTSKGVATTGDN